MGLLRIIPVVIAVIQLQGLIDASSPLPELPNNRLREGTDRELPNATDIECGPRAEHTGRVLRTLSVSSTVSSYFTNYAFTSNLIGARGLTFPNNIGTFSFAEVYGDYWYWWPLAPTSAYVYVLQADPSGESAYWLPQGKSIDIPQHPNTNQPRYVFTPDFSGCSWTVTPAGNGILRLRHVEGSKEAAQFNKLTEKQKGGPTTYAMQYIDYGYVVELARLVKSTTAFAYMHYNGSRWTLLFQRKTCATGTGGYQYQNNLLISTINVELPHSSYNPVTGTKTYTIP